jgi:hypothetical protein
MANTCRAARVAVRFDIRARQLRHYPIHATDLGPILIDQAFHCQSIEEYAFQIRWDIDDSASHISNLQNVVGSIWYRGLQLLTQLLGSYFFERLLDKMLMLGSELRREIYYSAAFSLAVIFAPETHLATFRRI